MLLHLEKHFQKIGAGLRIVTRGESARVQVPAVQVDVVEERRGELFEIAIRERSLHDIELSVLEVRPEDRHLVLFSRVTDQTEGIRKEHFLCGHDERHLFVAAVEGVSTVAAAKRSLKPEELRGREVGFTAEKANRRKTEFFRRQGEWFFLPAEIDPPVHLIRRQEPLVRGRGSKPHIAQFAYRDGGESVKVCSRYPNGVTLDQFAKLLKTNPRARSYNWADMRRGAAVYVRGSVRHPDHATIFLEGWHRVLMNRERATAAVAFLD